LILNLVRNGLEAMPPRKTLTIGPLLEDSQVVLFVQDQAAELTTNWQRDWDTLCYHKDNGTGLGLAVCYRIASHHSARIDFETGPQGTTFYVRFPVVQTEPQ
jgi:signal transduction histidine kinase